MWEISQVSENFITQMNLFTLYWQNKLWKLYGLQNGTRQHYTTLPGSMVSYGEHTQTHTFENHANLLNYLANWPLYTSEHVFQGTIKCQPGPFLQALLKHSLCLLFEKKTARMGSYYNIATCTDDYATMCPGTVMIHLWSIKSSLPSLYPLCDNL